MATGPAKQTYAPYPAHHDDVLHCGGKSEVNLTALRDVGDTDMVTWPVTVDIYLTLAGSHGSHDEAKQSGFAGTVRANHGNPLTFGHRECQVSQGIVASTGKGYTPGTIGKRNVHVVKFQGGLPWFVVNALGRQTGY